jgi:hypothetical protein
MVFVRNVEKISLHMANLVKGWYDFTIPNMGGIHPYNHGGFLVA